MPLIFSDGHQSCFVYLLLMHVIGYLPLEARLLSIGYLSFA